MASLASNLQIAIQQDLKFLAYSILHAINTNQYDSNTDFETFHASDFVAKNVVAINELAESNPLQIGVAKLYAVPSVGNAPAINLYFASNPYEVKQLHMKQPEYEQGMSRIYNITAWTSIELDINGQGAFKSMAELKSEVQTVPYFIGTLSEGLIDKNGLPIDFMKAGKTA